MTGGRAPSSDSAGRRAVEQRRTLAAACRRAQLGVDELWLRYFALGGDAGQLEVEAYLHGALILPSVQRDLLAQAVNERLDELAGSRATYSRTVHAVRPRHGPLAALVALLEGVHRAPPERLASAADSAGKALGVRLRIHLVDYEQHMLHLLPVPGEPPGEPLALDTTLPGRAFRRVETLPSAAGDLPRLWIPLLDGAERLGVLEVELADQADLDSPALRSQCGWLATLIGHLVRAVGDYGDGLDEVRRREPRIPAAELVWGLLPATTAGTGTFLVAGAVLPSYTVGGDVFDHALSETRAHLAVFDPTGHTLASAVTAAAAVAAYRSTRRNAYGLFDQVLAIEEALAESGLNLRFVTGVLAELDLESGLLRYVNAGHPAPLLVRGGKVVKVLGGGRRPLFGLGHGPLTVGEELLQPGDWLVLYTDGVTEARNDLGEFFGEARLVDFLRRAVAAGLPAPETVRRLVRAVLSHQGGLLQDDATVMLARWSGPEQQPEAD
jgi:Stage II sporulation protein E (SpoIIE)